VKRVRWSLTGVVLCCVAALAAPSAASADRYAAPGASGPEPCNPAPCSIEQAVEGAPDGERVILAPGTYTLTADLELDTAIEVGGQPGGPLPTLLFDFDSLRVVSPGAVLHDVRIEMPGPAMAVPLLIESGRVERVYSFTGELTGGACGVLGGLLRDSVCWGGFTNGLGVGASEPGPVHVDLRNVTANATIFGSTNGAELSVTAVNLLTQGQGTKKDVYVDVNTSSSATITLSHSNYSSVDTSLSAGTNYTYTQPGTNGNQTAEPLFANVGALDLRQLPGSPTIDAGTSDPLLGSLDLDGKARSQPPCIGGTPVPDIGAYENTPTTACAKPSNRFKFGKVKRNKKKGTAKLAVILPGPGKLKLSGKGVVGRSLSGKGTVKLLIKAKGKKKRTLERTGKVKVKAKVTFTPTGGDPNTQAKTVKLEKKRAGAGG
jgi:hypothetical protein